jgi:hypothetical protein
MGEADVLAEIRSVRDELARRYGDAWALSRALAEQSRAGGRAVVRLPPRQPQPPRAATQPASLPGVTATDARRVEAEPVAAPDPARRSDSQ